MKKIVLMLGIVLCCRVEYVKAACTANSDEFGNQKCLTWNPGVENNCGKGCTYTYENGTVNVVASGSSPKISEGMFSPMYYDGGMPVKIEHIVVDGNFESIGKHAFAVVGATISGKNGELVLNKSGWNAFGNETNVLQGDIVISDSAGTMGHGYLVNTVLDGTLIIPENITFASGPLRDLTVTKNGKIYCAVKNCEERLLESCNSLPQEDANGYDLRSRCNNSVQRIIDAGKIEAFPDGCIRMSGVGCQQCANKNYALEYGTCYRKRYTLPEADAATSNDNENMIEWIFE